MHPSWCLYLASWWFLHYLLVFTPKIGGRWTQFDLRVFFRWVGEKPPISETNQYPYHPCMVYLPTIYHKYQLQIKVKIHPLIFSISKQQQLISLHGTSKAYPFLGNAIARARSDARRAQPLNSGKLRWHWTTQPFEDVSPIQNNDFLAIAMWGLLNSEIKGMIYINYEPP